MMMDDLIIIIPTHNRQHYLNRVIKYYSTFPCKVYICDSSKAKGDAESNGNIIYRWVPQSNFYGKVLDVINETSADFYALSPDDDFLKEETLIECYNALKKNSYYSIGIGKQIFFDEPFNGLFYLKPNANGLQNLNGSNDSTNEEYINHFWQNYQNILWSLFRRDAISNAFRSLSLGNYKNGNFVELILGIESLRAGAVYISNQGLNYREVSKLEHWGSATLPITKKSLEKDIDLKNSFAQFQDYYSWDNGFALYCFNAYIAGDSERQSMLSKLAGSMPFSLKVKVKQYLYLIHKGKHTEYVDDLMKKKIMSVF